MKSRENKRNLSKSTFHETVGLHTHTIELHQILTMYWVWACINTPENTGFSFFRKEFSNVLDIQILDSEKF